MIRLLRRNCDEDLLLTCSDGFDCATVYLTPEDAERIAVALMKVTNAGVWDIETNGHVSLVDGVVKH